MRQKVYRVQAMRSATVKASNVKGTVSRSKLVKFIVQRNQGKRIKVPYKVNMYRVHPNYQ